MVKSKLKAKEKYKGVIDGKVLSLNPGDEFLCDPNLAVKLIVYYPNYFEVIGSESIEKLPEDLDDILEKKQTKVIKVKSKKIIELEQDSLEYKKS